MKVRMDFFGIFAGVKGAAQTYFSTSRNTGRTTSLIESLTSKDRVICANQRDAHLLKRKALDAGKEIMVLVYPTSNIDHCFHAGTSQGRTVFDHRWLEAFYLQAIENAQNAIEHAETALSGTGEPHRETRRRAQEMARWPNMEFR